MSLMNSIAASMSWIWKRRGENGGKCHVDWINTDGSRSSRTFASEADAQEFKRSLESLPPASPADPSHPTASPATLSLSRALERLIEQFRTRPEMIDRTPKYISDTERQIRTVLQLGEIEGLDQISDDAVGAALRKLQASGRALDTLNHYLTSISTFTRWLTRKGHLPRNPLDGVRRFRASSDRRHERAAYTIEQFVTLIRSVRALGKTYYGVAAEDRAMLYYAAVISSLRARALSLLRVDQFHFGDAPCITVEAWQVKQARDQIIRLPAQHAPLLAAYLANKTPSARAFRMPKYDCDRVRMLRKDLRDAGIPYCRMIHQEGKPPRRVDVLDFHALRCTFATWLDEQDVHLADLQRLIGHSTSVMTQRYIKSKRDKLRPVIDRFPHLPLTPSPQLELFKPPSATG